VGGPCRTELVRPRDATRATLTSRQPLLFAAAGNVPRVNGSAARPTVLRLTA